MLKKQHKFLLLFNCQNEDKNFNQSVHSTDRHAIAGTLAVVERVVTSSCSAESPGLTLGLKEGEDVALSDGSLHVADKSSVHSALELDLNLRDSTS